MKFLIKNYKDVKSIILLLLAASLPFHFHISNVLIAIGAGLTLLKGYASKSWIDFKPDKLSVVFIGYFFLEVIGLAYTDQANLHYGLSILEKHQALILVPLIFIDYKIESGLRDKILLTFVASCFVATLICTAANIYASLAIYDTFVHPWQFSHNRYSEPIGMGAVYFAMYLSLSFLITLQQLKEKGHHLSGIKKSLLVALLVYFLFVIIALGARTVTVMLMFILFIAMIQFAWTHRSFKMLVLAVMIPLIFVAIVLTHPIVNTRFKDMMKDNYESSNYGSYFARLKIWEPGIEAIKENFWLGTGTGDHETELNKKFVEYNYTEGIDLFNMHNQYLQTLLIHGVAGLVLFLYILFIQLRKTLQQRDLIYLLFLFLFMGACLTESMLSRNKGLIFFLIFSFIFYKSNETALGPDDNRDEITT